MKAKVGAMLSKLWRIGLCGAILCSSFLVPGLAEAAPKDAQAQKALKQAMEEDYLDTNFDGAQSKLEKALDACGSNGCASAVKAKLHIGLGIVLGGGKGKKDEAQKAFIEALKLDKNAAPDPDYVTSDIKAIFEDAQKKAKSGGGGPATPPPGDSPLSVSPIAAQKKGVPIPIYVTVDSEQVSDVARVELKYMGAGSSSTKTLKLERAGKAYRGNIPCAAVKKTGSVRYWLLGFDKSESKVAEAGSKDEPISTEIVADLDDKPPSWPGFAPPDPCKPGEGGDDEVEAKSSERQCVDDGDCPSGEACSGQTCLLKASESGSSGTEETPDDGARMNWIRLTFAPDFTIISGADLCGFDDAYEGGTPSQSYNGTYVCSKNPDSEKPSRYLGRPERGQGNNINGGLGVSTMRLMLGYDRVLVAGLSLGARVGFAFNGTTEEFASFIPVHGEGRVAYTFGSNPFAGQVVRPWIFLSGGFAQVDTGVNVDVLEDGEACGAADPGDRNSDCTVESESGEVEPRIQTLKAINQAGLGFAGGGAGISFVPVDLFEINLGLKFAVMFPAVVPVLAPEVGIGFGF